MIILGPIYIPQAGKTVAITPESIAFYKRIIEVYEGSELGIDNTITQNGTTVLLNGKPNYSVHLCYGLLLDDGRQPQQLSRCPFLGLCTHESRGWLNLFLFG